MVNGKRVDKMNNQYDWGLLDTVVPLTTASEIDNTPWASKKPMLVWRGSSTGGKRHYKKPTRHGRGVSSRWTPLDMHPREHVALLGIDHPDLLNVTLFLDSRKRIKAPLLYELLNMSSVVFVDKEQSKVMVRYA